MNLFRKQFEIVLILLFFIFSWWLMDKSFGYDVKQHTFRVARHQVGDFGLHLSLIRSFSVGDNFPVESPFFPGKPLPYHYFFDLLVGILERLGTRIDIALNGLSTVFFTILLFFIYKLPQVLFGKNRILGILSVVLFIFHSNLTFVDFFKNRSLGLSLFHDLWRLPDYLHKGPFDGSIISIFFTLNVYLNQRHFIAALAISLGMLYFLIPKIISQKKISTKTLVALGFVLGITSRVHTLTFFSTLLIVFLLFFVFKRFRYIFLLFPTSLLVFYFHLKTILGQEFPHQFFNPGFLAQKPLTFGNFTEFWLLNLGVALVLIPIGVILSNKTQRKFFLCFISLFIIGNIFQLSFRIEHNHSLFNYFFIIANFYIAFALTKLWKKGLMGKLGMIIILFFLTFSGLIDFMAVKNDFQYTFSDAPQNAFMEWIKTRTDRNDIFISRQEILDPVTLSGRKNFLGHQYYLEVMGYKSSERESLVKEVFEADTKKAFEKARVNKVKFVVLPKKKIPDFNYRVNVDFFKKYLNIAYQDNDVLVFRL